MHCEAPSEALALDYLPLSTEDSITEQVKTTDFQPDGYSGETAH